MKAKVTVTIIEKATNKVVSKDERFFESTQEAIKKVLECDKVLFKNLLRFSYTIDDIED